MISKLLSNFPNKMKLREFAHVCFSISAYFMDLIILYVLEIGEFGEVKKEKIALEFL